MISADASFHLDILSRYFALLAFYVVVVYAAIGRCGILPAKDNHVFVVSGGTIRLGWLFGMNKFGLSFRMQWFFLVFVCLWILVSIASPVIAFCLTVNPLSFSLFGLVAPPVYILRRITFYLFPVK